MEHASVEQLELVTADTITLAQVVELKLECGRALNAGAMTPELEALREACDAAIEFFATPKSAAARKTCADAYNARTAGS